MLLAGAPLTLDTRRDRIPNFLAFKIRTVQEPIVIGARRLTRKPQPVHVSAQVLMRLDARAGGPVGVAAVGPLGLAPAGIVEGGGLGHGFGAEHVAEHG